jgi:hypothetical protein
MTDSLHFDYDSEYQSLSRPARKKFNTELFEAVKQTYRNNGYIEEKDFPGEYYFLFNPVTGEQVRLYYHGKVQEGKV